MTGIQGVTGATGGSFRFTGVQTGRWSGSQPNMQSVRGVTGLGGGAPTQKAELIPRLRDLPLNEEKRRLYYTCPKTNKAHCPFGPAVILKLGDSGGTREEWWIDGVQLSQEYIKKVKYILDPANLEEAPLFMNDEILSYPARWVLRFSDKRDIEGLEDDALETP